MSSSPTYEEFAAWKALKKQQRHDAIARQVKTGKNKNAASAPVSTGAAPTTAAKAPFMAWAVLRNFHEAVRMSLKEMSEAVNSDETARARSLFRDLRRAMEDHAAVEDAAIMAYLASFGPLSKDEFPVEHVEDDRLAKIVLEADNDSYASKYNSYKSNLLAHLKHEEEQMMPLTQKTGSELLFFSIRFFHVLILLKTRLGSAPTALQFTFFQSAPTISTLASDGPSICFREWDRRPMTPRRQPECT